MRILSFLPSLFFSLLFLTVSTSMLAQQNIVVQLDGVKMRAALELPKGTSTVTICGLEPGNSYKVIAAPMAFEQRAEFEIAPAPALTKGTGGFAFMRQSKNEVRFAAPNACVEIQVKTSSTEQGEQVPMYLSIRCETCPESKAWLRKVTGQENQAVLEIEKGLTVQELVEDVLVGGGCFQISNVTYSGQADQIGSFSNGLTNIGFSSGLIMATGDIDIAPGPNDTGGDSGGFGIGTPDDDLEAIATGNIFDMANIEFDFVPTQNQVVFEFAFASEEYCEYVNTNFNDVFGFFISGPGIVGTKNLAVIPNSNNPITINNLNHLVNSSLYTHNTPITGNNCGILPAFGPAVFELQYDGFTKKMTAVANVIPCETYHIKLKIADVFDGVWDSAVFLRANSFNAGGGVLVSPAYPGSHGSSYESCDEGSVRFQRGNSDTSLPLPISFTIGGSATPGVDYVPINNTVVIPAGQTEVLVPITVLPDFLPEGQENILFSIPNSCACSQSTVEFLINDRPVLFLEAMDQFLCAGETATLQSTVSGGLPNANHSFLWSTGETTASINPTSTGTYTLTVTDGCSNPAAVSIELVFENCGCDAETFIKTIGEIGQEVRGYGIYDSQDGNLYITGSKQDSALIIKMTPAGTVLWMRTFDVTGSDDQISELIVDSEGMIVGCGHRGDLSQGFVFRYNPATNNMQWINTYGLPIVRVFGLMELPNGNFLVYDHPSNNNDPRILEITRSDGSIDLASPLSQRLRLNSPSRLNSATIFNGKFYGVGSFTNNGNVLDRTRHTLTQIDLNSGNLDWTRLSHIAPGQTAQLHGIDMLIEDNHIISVGFGSEIDDDLGNSQVFLQKNGLDGEILWLKRFNIPAADVENAEELVSVPDGFLIYIHDNSVSGGDLYLLKTDKDGNFQWAKKFDSGFNDLVLNPSHFQSQILVKDNHLFFAASTLAPGADFKALLVKTTLDGTVEGNCNFIQPVQVESSDVINPTNLPVILEKIPFNEATTTIALTPESTHLLVENQCKVFVNDSIAISLCFGESVTIDSVSYAQDTTFSVEITGPGGCDTLRTYTIDVLPQPMRAEAITLCPGEFVIIGGQMIDQAGTFILSVEGVNGECDTMVTYTISSAPYQTRSEDVSFCVGTSVTIGGQVYDQSGTVVDTLPSATACDTIVTYTLTQLPYQTDAQNISFCAGESVTIGGIAYNQSGTVIDTLPSSGGACDVIVTYTLTQLPYQTRSENISFCPGSSVTIDGQVYNQSGTVIDTLPSVAACDTIVTYTLTLLTQPTRTETIAFCPGETITLGGTVYTQPGTVVLNLASNSGGCDTIATYTLQFSTPAPSTVGINCPSAITIGLPGGSNGTVVDYNQPNALSDCTCPGIALNMTSGLPSGSNFPMGVTSVCFVAKDSCGQTSSCCFNVTLEEDDPCDTKVVGCMKYELLTITQDAGKNRTYRVRVTNNCSNKLIYTAIQIPNGLVAMEPANFSTYTAPSGNTYRVRSPNFSPQYSVRYSSISDSLQNGESDIFKYTLPAQADVTFIHVVSRLAPYIYLGAHLNTFYCPIGVTPTGNREGTERGEEDLTIPNFSGLSKLDELLLFPNPTSGELFADFSPWKGQALNIQVLDSRGQRVQQISITAGDDAQALDLPGDLPSGLYFLEFVSEAGERQMGRFVLQR